MTDVPGASSYVATAWGDRLGILPTTEADGTLTIGGRSASPTEQWLGGRCGAPRPHPERPGTVVLPGGLPADDPAVRSRVEEVTAALAETIRAVHALDVAGCPVHLSTADRLARADGPTALLDHVSRLAELVERRTAVAAVVTIGAARLDTVTVDVDDTGRLGRCGLVTVDGVAVADPYRDLAAAARSLAATYGPETLPRFFELVGHPEPDPIRLELHAALDELGV